MTEEKSDIELYDGFLAPVLLYPSAPSVSLYIMLLL